METTENLSLEELLIEIEEHAKSNFDGHLTIFRFSSGWKLGYGTPRLDRNDDAVGNSKVYKELKKGLEDLLLKPTNFYNESK